MSLSGTEILSDLPALLDLGNSGEAAVAKLNAIPTKKAVDYADAIGLSPGGMGHAICATFDQVKSGPVTLDEVAGILGVDPGGVLGKALALLKTIEAQIES